MRVLRLILVLFVLTALRADVLANVEVAGGSLADIPDLMDVQRFTDTIAALADDVGHRIGIRGRAGGPQSGEPSVGRPVLEPGTMFLMGFGLLGISIWARRWWARRR